MLKLSKNSGKVSLNKSFFVISVDVELAWGFRDSPILMQKYRPFLEKSRYAMKNLLKICELYEIPLTLAIVGKLLEENQHISHPFLNRREYWYAEDIIADAVISPIKHEIASHSYSHVDFLSCSPTTAFNEIHKSKEIIIRRLKINPISFIYPRSKIAYLDILINEGFICYRGRIPSLRNKLNSRIGGIAEKFLLMLGGCPPVIRPHYYKGLWEIAGSMLFQPSFLETHDSLIKQAKRGIQKAIKTNSVFHLILHDYSLTTSEMIKAFSHLMRLANKLRKLNLLEITTLEGLIKKLAFK